MRRIIQLFQWRIIDIIPIVQELKNKFTAIQISPLQPIKDNGGEWWKLYQPCDLTIGNYLGTTEDLTKLTEECKKYNIEVYADLVLNHVAGANDGTIKPHEKVNPKLINKYFIFCCIAAFPGKEAHKHEGVSNCPVGGRRHRPRDHP